LPPAAFWLAVVLKLKGLRRVSRKLQGHGAERAAVTLQGLLDEAFDIQVKALAKGHYAAAVTALTVLITRYAVSIVAVTSGAAALASQKWQSAPTIQTSKKRVAPDRAKWAGVGGAGARTKSSLLC
jgi:hypothetical protein